MNGKLLYNYLQFTGLADWSPKSSLLLVTTFAHVAQTTVLYPLHVIQTRLNADIGRAQQRQFLSMGDIMSRLPRLDPSSNPRVAGLNTFYRGFVPYNITGLIYIHTFMQLNSFLVRKMKDN